MFPRVRVKICGITNITDALLAAELGADALGFIFVAKSPRAMTPSGARAIIDRLPPLVTTVAVMVNETIETMREIMAVSGCRVAQLHGNEPPECLHKLGWPAMKAVSVAVEEDLHVIVRYQAACAMLLDTKVAGQYGGTGHTFDWRIARQAQQYGKPIVLAGGLTPENIVEAVHVAQPFAVDVSSGIELTPGLKDHARMRMLFAALAACRGEE